MSAFKPDGAEAGARSNTGVNHVAYTYANLGDLLENYARLKQAGITPYWPIHHGITLSLYYLDPDGTGGFVFSVSFGYFVKWFGSYDLALIPVALLLTIAAVAWLRIDATEELIPERPMESIPEAAALVLG